MMKDRPEASSPSARVLIVDDHPVVREGFAACLSRTPDFVLCGEAEGMVDALAQVDAVQPDIVVVDLSLPAGNGLDLIKRLRARHAQICILVWSMHGEELYAERALRAGALGYVTKGRPTCELIAALRSVRAGHVYVGDDVSEKLLGRLVGSSKPGSVAPIESLSDRELEAFTWMGHGLTTLQIAEKMHVSPRTVDSYRARIKEKLEVSHVSEIVQRAAQWLIETRE